MDKRKLIAFLSKYRYVLIVLAVGVILMLLPSGKTEKQETTTTVYEAEQDVEAELASILSMINGAGRVEVMLTAARGEEICYQTNKRGEDYNTVTITDSSRNEAGLVSQINPPIYLGAIIVCDGGDSPTVRLAIVESVAKVTGLGADRISVMKMK